MWRFLSRLQTEQPLLLFLAFGLALLGADALFRSGDPGGGTPEIVIGGEQARRLLDRYPDAARQIPTPAQLRAVLGLWIEEEVLTREAQRIGLDAGDVIVRRRLAQKMQELLEQLHPVAEPSDGELRALLDADPMRYGHAATVSFEQVFLSRGRRGASLVADAAQVLEQLRIDGAGFRELGDSAPTGPVVSAATSDALRDRYGGAFAAALDSLPIGAWQGPIASSLGMHLVRITAREPGRSADLTEVRDKLARDWRIERRAALDREAIEAMIARYPIAVHAPEESD